MDEERDKTAPGGSATGSNEQGTRPDPILALRGLGSEIWRDEDPDDYVKRLREGWQ